MSTPPHAHERERVAVVGSGLAGLLSAYLLARDGRYAVTIFESVRCAGTWEHASGTAVDQLR